MPGKYTVLNERGELLEDRSFFVMRDSDVLASSGLWAYVHTLQTLLELSEQGLTSISPTTLNSLYDLRDFVSELAQDWQMSDRRNVPS